MPSWNSPPEFDGTLSSGTFVAPAATTTAPEYTYSGDTDTGWGRSDTNQITAYTGGTARLVVQSDGRVDMRGNTGTTYLTVGTAGTSYFTVDNAGDATALGGFKTNGATFIGETSRAGVPTTAELPTDGDVSLHYNSTGGTYWLAYNNGGTIYTVQLT